ncbi:uncharacterized protein A4U43_C02F11110 [Asparagus officinalis]|uniref:NTF2-related export protein n=1 Tax=Asparagus officinalis TaxID=4686 RepID=A0A5P1FIB7_ASPOF|nr:uncharacterized protein A4U43_C02F11110 [Asparagus officinalis]
MDPDALAKAFVEHYYRTFDSNRAGLGNLYQESSMLTFEGAKTQGAQAIVAKLVGLPFQQCLRHPKTKTPPAASLSSSAVRFSSPASSMPSSSARIFILDAYNIDKCRLSVPRPGFNRPGTRNINELDRGGK